MVSANYTKPLVFTDTLYNYTVITLNFLKGLNQMKTPQSLTIKDLMQAFAVSHMTISTMRKGTPTRPEPLPTMKTTSPSIVLFDPAQTKGWAKRNGVAIVVPFSKLNRVAVKRGPKPKVSRH